MPFSPVLQYLLDGANLATVATVMPDGSPQVSAVWIGYDGDDLVFTTVEGVQKVRNLRRDPRVAITIFDHQDPYVVASIRGAVCEITTAGGKDLVDRLAKKYLGWDEYVEGSDPAKRLVVRIRVETVHTRNLGYRARSPKA